MRLVAPSVLALALVLALAPRAAAQAPAPSLEEAARTVAGWWARGDADAVAGVVTGAGARLNVEEERHAVLAPRQVRATLENLFAGLSRGRVVVERTESVGGAPLRGWTELRWETVAPGTDESVSFRVFVGFIEAEGRWRIDEIRVLR